MIWLADAISNIKRKDMNTMGDVLKAVKDSENLKIEVLRNLQPLALDETDAKR